MGKVYIYGYTFLTDCRQVLISGEIKQNNKIVWILKMPPIQLTLQDWTTICWQVVSETVRKR